MRMEAVSQRTVAARLPSSSTARPIPLLMGTGVPRAEKLGQGSAL